ncbi:hypothetical protein BD324DRAFT_635899 [Kockovaella imperatae]|uniref:BZIP domain-containing protein n=1 Tax=Kockovaella imperatae TaxID=4999 RepID=A0A1Y1U8T9_9TREE|nr:hypothetical protein BD324DRAFT_635899 [Kockovaella imperatae]ORX34432.1 hypothetical protein BD324DRAFT_635899 [Kockovaella imperatae]
MSSIASSSKLFTPKRSRDEESPSDVEDIPMDDAARAKQARKDARTIRNRESAQRSRNQRKAHMSYLETRVAELEAENKALRGSTREPSPTLTTVSFSDTVNLASVAPPPRDLDIKPTIEELPTLSSLQAENASLRERIALLENLVKQVVAVSNLGGLDKPADVTVSPSLAPAIPLVIPSSTDLTCHPAAMATSDSLALQRVRPRSPWTHMTLDRLDMVARLFVAVARRNPTWGDKCSPGTMRRAKCRSRRMVRNGIRR